MIVTETYTLNKRRKKRQEEKKRIIGKNRQKES